jgi:hypothetical protein
VSKTIISCTRYYNIDKTLPPIQMKKITRLTILVLSLLVFSFTTYGQTESQEKSKEELKAEQKGIKKAKKAAKKEASSAARAAANDYSRYTSLADILRQQSGVIVKGTGQFAQVQIRGMNSIMLDNRPLYVYNGIELGRDYTKANNTIDRATIGSIRVLASLSEVNFYGERGRNGVIIIKSKR